jgi:hypothetical protein
VKEVFCRFPLAFSPLVEVWLEEAFVELSHASECGSSVEEVELFVILFVHLRGFSEILLT